MVSRAENPTLAHPANDQSIGGGIKRARPVIVAFGIFALTIMGIIAL